MKNTRLRLIGFVGRRSPRGRSRGVWTTPAYFARL